MKSLFLFICLLCLNFSWAMRQEKQVIRFNFEIEFQNSENSIVLQGDVYGRILDLSLVINKEKILISKNILGQNLNFDFDGLCVFQEQNSFNEKFIIIQFYAGEYNQKLKVKNLIIDKNRNVTFEEVFQYDALESIQIKSFQIISPSVFEMKGNLNQNKTLSEITVSSYLSTIQNFEIPTFYGFAYSLRNTQNIITFIFNSIDNPSINTKQISLRNNGLIILDSPNIVKEEKLVVPSTKKRNIDSLLHHLSLSSSSQRSSP